MKVSDLYFLLLSGDPQLHELAFAARIQQDPLSLSCLFLCCLSHPPDSIEQQTIKELRDASKLKLAMI